MYMANEIILFEQVAEFTNHRGDVSTAVFHHPDFQLPDLWQSGKRPLADCQRLLIGRRHVQVIEERQMLKVLCHFHNQFRIERVYMNRDSARSWAGKRLCSAQVDQIGGAQRGVHHVPPSPNTDLEGDALQCGPPSPFTVICVCVGY